MQVIASTCLFLAGKVEDTPRQLKDVIYVTYSVRHKKDKGAEDLIKQSKVSIGQGNKSVLDVSIGLLEALAACFWTTLNTLIALVAGASISYLLTLEVPLSPRFPYAF